MIFSLNPANRTIGKVHAATHWMAGKNDLLNWLQAKCSLSPMDFMFSEVLNVTEEYFSYIESFP